MQGWDGRGLVSTDWLAANLEDERLRIFDVTVHLRPANPGPFAVESGHADYEAEHVPGAAFLDLASDLSDGTSGFNFTMPSSEAFASALAAAGIGARARVVAYSSTTPMWATRLWWMLRTCGFDEVAVLDGGLAKWKAEGQAVETGTSRYPSDMLALTSNAALWADSVAVLSAIGDGGVCTINALPSDIHTGKDATRYARTGHIRGSRNVPFDSLLKADGSYRPDVELRALFDAVGVFGCERAICYCGGGISATMDALALVRLGHPSVAVYDGSLSEWARDPALPMEMD